MTCPDNPLDCPGEIAGGLIGNAATSAWESVCRSFAEAATELMKGFAKAFVAIPPVDLNSGGIKGVYAISLALAATIAAILLIGQIIRTAVTHDGSALAQGFLGVGKAALAFMVTLTVAGASLIAADELTAFIVERTFGSTRGLEDKLAGLMAFNPNLPSSLLLILAVLGILLIVVLWFELLLRNAAIAVLIATSPIAAAGQVSEATKGWWSKLVTATVQLIILKPIIALVFGLGFGMMSDTKVADVQTLLAGMLILLLAALAWPAIARFFTFANVYAGGGSGVGAVLGFAAGRLSTTSGGGSPVGVNPAQFSQAAEARTMAGMAGSSGSVGAATAGTAGAIAIPVLVAKAGIDMAQKAANSMTNRMEHMAGHAGLPNRVPYVPPAGHTNPYAEWAPSSRTQQAAVAGAGGADERAAPPVPPQPMYEPGPFDEPGGNR